MAGLRDDLPAEPRADVSPGHGLGQATAAPRSSSSAGDSLAGALILQLPQLPSRQQLAATDLR